MKRRFPLFHHLQIAFRDRSPCPEPDGRSSLFDEYRVPSPHTGEVAWLDTCVSLPPGSGVKMARATYTPEPEYSEPARKTKIRATVQLAVAINATRVAHVVRDVKPLEPGLDQNAVEAIEKWRLTPATKDRKPVAVQMEVEVG